MKKTFRVHGSVVPSRAHVALRKHLPKGTPHARYWIKAGIRPACAERLVKAGIVDLATLALHSREEVLGISGVNQATLRACEKLLGRPLRSNFGYWREKGLPPRVAAALDKAGIGSVEALAEVTREELSWFHGVGDRGIELCETLLGRPFPSAVSLWTDQGLSDETARKLVRFHVVSLATLAERLGDLVKRLDDIEVRACQEILVRQSIPRGVTSSVATMSASYLGSSVAAWRLAAGLTQMELAGCSGVRVELVDNFEQAREQVSLETMVRLCMGLETKLGRPMLRTIVAEAHAKLWNELVACDRRLRESGPSCK